MHELSHSNVARLWPVGLGLFFAAATVICATVALTLAAPGTALDWAWTLKPQAHLELAQWRALTAPMFAGLAVAMAFASYGTFRRRRWGWLLACALFAANGVGDAIQLMNGALTQGIIGVVIVAVLLVALFRSSTREVFSN